MFQGQWVLDSLVLHQSPIKHKEFGFRDHHQLHENLKINIISKIVVLLFGPKRFLRYIQIKRL